jgi:hypothetical protein
VSRAERHQIRAGLSAFPTTRNDGIEVPGLTRWEYIMTHLLAGQYDVGDEGYKWAASLAEKILKGEGAP